MTSVPATSFAHTPTPPYYAVIFASRRRDTDQDYDAMAQRMAELAAQQPGFLGADSARDANGFGITVSYWASEQAIIDWKAHAEHQLAQQQGKSQWYEHYEIRIAKVERAYGMRFGT